jgi:cellulose synthase/poly-beta-1,6-N-acetylglucosamine synthase-like glycosyltransferase
VHLSDLIAAAQWFFFVYLTGINAGYVLLTLLSFGSIKRYMDRRALESLPKVYSGLETPVSILVPAYNEEATIVASIRSLLQLNYSEFEIVVVNDGSKDETLRVLLREFAMVPFPEAYRKSLNVKPVRAIYRSTLNPNLRVIDKENGGKADSLNAGINASRYPLFCAVDADSILERDSLHRVVLPFLEDPTTIASGGTVRIANGCTVTGGFLTRIGLSSNLLALLQIVEYLRAFLAGRLGWSPMNAVLIISGAFGVFRKDRVVEAGGYRTDCLGEDMELVVRLHRLHREQGRPYRVVFVPDPVCWTEAPESLRILKSQRVRWQRGLAESLALNKSLLFSAKGGAAGWIAFPFMAAFEWIGPLIEVVGYVFMTLAFCFGFVSPVAFVTFVAMAFCLGLLLSVSAILLEELAFQTYPKPHQLLILLLMAVIDNLGFRQVVSAWRVIGLWRWMWGSHSHWGEMRRTASWQRAA